MEFYNVRDITLASGHTVQYKNFKDDMGVEYEQREVINLHLNGKVTKSYMILKTPEYQNT